jgi:hypothetical protein
MFAIIITVGCGRVTIPGNQFKTPEVNTSIAPKMENALPKVSSFELGAADAKVRVLAFLPIDSGHQQLMALLKELVKQYPGKLYVKYLDPRTPEGMQTMQRVDKMGTGLLINGEMAVELKDKNPPYTINFEQDMGRYWTAEHLRVAVAQKVAEAYNK